MGNPTNVYGDIRIPNRTFLGRPTHRLAIGDSIINSWFGTHCTQTPNVVGYDDTVCGGIVSRPNATLPSAPVAGHIAGYWAYLYRATTGQAVIRGAHAINASAINIYNLAGGLLPAGSGYPMAGMTLTVDTAGQQETLRIATAYAGTGGGLPSAGADSNSITLASNTAKTHADGTIISWTRPSGIRGYSMKTVAETLFATAASPQDATWLNNRISDFTLVGDNTSMGDGIETNYFHEGPIMNSGAFDVVMLYLALPVNIGAPNLRLRGRTAELAPVETFVDFSIYNATPQIKAVTLAMAAPSAYSSTVAPRFVVNSPNVGNFTAGQVFVCLGFFAMKHGATSGQILSAMSDGGMQIQDLANDAGSFGTIYDPVYMAQHWAALAGTVIGAPDILEINLGQNKAPTGGSAGTMLKNIRANAIAAGGNTKILYATPYNTVGLNSSGSDALLVAACQALGREPNFCAFDFITDCGNLTMVTNHYTSDGTHPTAGGKEWFSAQYAKMLKSCEAAVGWAGSGDLAWPTWNPKRW